jgi:hypothetical protein
VKPVYQTVRGGGGNCYSACLASVLEVEIGDVPDFRGFRDLGRWLAGRGWGLRVVAGDGMPLESQSLLPSGYAILSHRTPNGHNHAALFHDGRLAHDPDGRPLCHPRSLVLFWATLWKLSP